MIDFDELLNFCKNFNGDMLWVLLCSVDYIHCLYIYVYVFFSYPAWLQNSLEALKLL